VYPALREVLLFVERIATGLGLHLTRLTYIWNNTNAITSSIFVGAAERWVKVAQHPPSLRLIETLHALHTPLSTRESEEEGLKKELG
jgi:hypothetical protein